MDTPFIYNKFVTGAEFVSREYELNSFANMVRQGQHVLLYEPPKSGKKSLVQQGLMKLRNSGYHFNICNINFFNIRTKKQLLQKYATTLFRNVTHSPQEYKELQEKLFPKMEQYFGEKLDFSNPDTDTSSIPQEIEHSILNLPQAIAQELNSNIIIYLEEFQELLLLENPHQILAEMEKQFASHNQVTYIITGSLVNSMKVIFEEKKYFYSFAERIKLYPLEIRALNEFYRKNFLKTGRVVSQELCTEMFHLTEGHPWYAQQLGDISYSLTRGYLTPQVLNQSFLSLLELHSYRYQIITSRLSRFQINFLKAIMDNVEQLSSAESIKYYGFNSSANVKRLKDAVKRKEILTQENGEWIFLDPLFKTWLQKVYFEL